MGVHFHTDTNVVGYARDNNSPAWYFRTKDQAIPWIADAIDDDWDSEYLIAAGLQERRAIDDRYTPAYKAVNSMTDDDFVLVVSADGNSARAYVIYSCNDEVCPD